MLTTLILIILVLALIGVLPTWKYSSSWGYSPVGFIVLLLILWLFFGGRLVA